MNTAELDRGLELLGLAKAQVLAVYSGTPEEVAGQLSISKARWKQLFRKASLKHHPDHGGSAGDFRLLREAWTALNELGGWVPSWLQGEVFVLDRLYIGRVKGRVQPFPEAFMTRWILHLREEIRRARGSNFDHTPFRPLIEKEEAQGLDCLGLALSDGYPWDCCSFKVSHICYATRPTTYRLGLCTKHFEKLKTLY